MLEQLLQQLNKALSTAWEEWEIPRDVIVKWPDSVKKLHDAWWKQRISRQKEIDASIAAKAEFEYLYDKPYVDNKKVRVAGPFTVESLTPHRVLGVDENDELIDGAAETGPGIGEERNFVRMILENLKTAGVQQAHKEDKITFTALTPWPGDLICAEGRYEEKGEEGNEKGEEGRVKGEKKRSSPIPPALLPLRKSARRSSSGRSSALSPAPTWSKPPARRAMPVLMCSSPVRSTTTPTPPSSPNWAASRCSRRA